jgi:predicted TIM-barrel fold metal-dependent hydrolase
MDDPRWRRGYALLERHGLSYDLQTPWWHLDAAADLAHAFPRTRSSSTTRDCHPIAASMA